MASDITGATRLYAAGGGGASVNRADQTSQKYLGGVGGSFFGECWLGGNGAGVDGGETGRAFNPIPATSGVDGTGSGGGGGVSYEGAYETAGDGGDGVVVIRLSGFLVGTVPVPTAASFVYDGEAHRGVAEHFAYELTGTTVATDAGVYTTTATIKPGFPLEWGDAIGGQGSRVIKWEILKPVSPGEYVPEQYDDELEALSVVGRINDNKTGFIAAPEGVTTTPDYLKLFAARSVFKSGKYVVEIGLTSEAETMLRKQVSDSVEDEAADLVDVSQTSATVKTIPGLYYMILGGTEVGDISTSGTRTLATGGTTVLPKPNLGVTTKAFYRISVSEK